MATNPLDKVYLSKSQLDNIATGGTITSGSDTYTADETALYLTDNTSVLFEGQMLTTEQKTQARTNIGAMADGIKYGKSLSVSGTSVSLKDQDGTTLSTITTQDTTYQSKNASQSGTEVSLVTTGEKYTWNSKQDALPTESAAGKVLKSTSTAGVVVWDTLPSSTPTDVKINGTSITSGGVADIITEGAYNATSNKIATMSDLPASITITTTSGSESISDGINTLSFGANAFNSTTIPTATTLTTTTGSEAVTVGNDTLNVVTRDTAQTITETKVFSSCNIVLTRGSGNIVTRYNNADYELLSAPTAWSGTTEPTTQVGNESGTIVLRGYNERPIYKGNNNSAKELALYSDLNYIKLSSPITNTTTTTTDKVFDIQAITGDTDTSHEYEIYGLWHLYDTGTNYGWLWSDLWGYSSGSSTLLMNTTSNSRVAQVAFTVPCKNTTTGLKAKLNASADESLIAIFGYRRIK